MKKIWIIYSMFLCIFLLSSCGKEKSPVHFEIDKDIQIEIDEYHEYYMFGEQVVVTMEGKRVPVYEITTRLKKGETLSEGKHIIEIIYTTNQKEYVKEVEVTFIDSYSLVTLYVLGQPQTIRVKNQEPFDTSMVSLDDLYTLEGLYEDASYLTYFNPTKLITSDITLYAKISRNQTYVKGEINVDSVAQNMNSYIDKLIAETKGYIPAWNKESFKGRWNYIDGVFLNSVVNLYKETGNLKYKKFFLNYINYYIDEEGNFIHPETKEITGYKEGELDSVCASRILFDAFEMTEEPKYLIALNKTYRSLMDMPLATGTQNFSHKTTYLNQIWLDGMYMYVPFLARYAEQMNQVELFSRITEQYKYIRNHMFDEEKKLYYHGHDTTREVFWADSKTGNSQSFWLRSMGWFIVSLVDVLEYYPNGENKDYLTSLLKEALQGILLYQDSKTKLFYQVIDQGPNGFMVPKKYLQGLKNQEYQKNGTYLDTMIFNYLESSGSSMIAYALLKASRLNYIDSSYQEVGKDIFEGVYDYSYQNGKLNHICITAGLGPETNPIRDGSIAYYLAEPVGADDAKGVGPFLMAYIEYAKLNHKIEHQKTASIIFPYNETKEYNFKDSLPLSSIEIPAYIDMTFEGFYIVPDSFLPLDYVIEDSVEIYAQYEWIEDLFEHIKKHPNHLLKEDFNSYSQADSLPKWDGVWGTRGIYDYIHDKNGDGTNVELNHIKLGDGTAYLYDNSEYDGTQMIVDFGNSSSKVLRGHMEVELEHAGNSWTFFQIYGKRTDGTTGEVFGARFEDGILKYRINGGAVQVPYSSYIYPEEEKFVIDYFYDLNSKRFSLIINQKEFLLNYRLSLAESLYGIKIVTSDGMAYSYDSNGNKVEFHRRARIDNIYIITE